MLLSQVSTVMFQFKTSNSFQNYQNVLSCRRNVIVQGFLKDQRVYSHNVFFLDCVNWGFFSRCKDLWHRIIKPVYKIAFVIFRHLIALPPRTWAYGTFSSSWSLWRNLVHHRTHVVCLVQRTLDDCFSSGFILNWTRKNACAQQCAQWPGVEPLLTGRESSPKTYLLLGFKHSLSIILCILVQLDLIEAC